LESIVFEPFHDLYLKIIATDIDTQVIAEIDLKILILLFSIIILMKIKLYLVRHGLSCCNVLHHQKFKYISPLNVFHKDPYLTLKGQEQSKKAGEYIKGRIADPDIVFTSSLIRAIETGLCMFPGKNVQIAPYICERTPNVENVPYNFESQTKRLKLKVKNYNKVIKCNQDEGLSSSDFNKFIDYLIKNCDNIENKTVVVVTHSLLLMKTLNLKERMNNNAIIEIMVDTNTYNIEAYKQLFTGYVFPKHVDIRMSMR